MVFPGGKKCARGTLDLNGQLRTGERITSVIDGSEIFGKSKVFGGISDTFAASDTRHLALFALRRAFFTGVAIDMHFGIRRNKGDDLAGADFDTSAASDTKFPVDKGKIVDDLNGAERTDIGAAPQSQTSAAAPLGSPADERSGVAVADTVVVGTGKGLHDITAAADNGTFPHFF